ncbi:MAG: lamin tail domain-containing protein [Chloroflexi bacterium]|nr:lamin tail domain-containing protein [Chloroflexota bacterium]
MWKKPSQLSWFYLLLMATAVPSPFAAAQTAPPPLLITEIYADTPGDDAAEEWLELAYFGEAPLPLAGYQIGDEESTGGGEGMMAFPEGASIAPNEVIVVAQTAVGFRALFGQNPTYEMRESDPAVPNMLPVPSLATGEIGLANGGDEVLLLDANDEWLDAISYGDSTAVFAPVRAAPRGQSLERTPSPCDTDSAADWRVQPTPTPLTITPGECEQGTGNEGQGTGEEGQETGDEGQVTNDQGQLTNDQRQLTIPIGQVQGSSETAALLNRRVTVQGIVTGLHSDQNLEGIVYHTFFMQDVPGTEDGDPATSDGLAVFSGRRWHGVAIGDEVLVTGNVLEFFGLTELDDAQLEIAVLSSGNPLPTPVELAFPLLANVLPADSQRTTYEALEGMLVQINEARVLGGSYDGCGFAVARPMWG